LPAVIGKELRVVMEQKLLTPEGRGRYLRRQASVERVVGIIDRVLGFEQFSIRGLQKLLWSGIWLVWLTT
jgi:DDE family transposase